jgi:DNA-binding MarR family transcriptional regulator
MNSLNPEPPVPPNPDIDSRLLIALLRLASVINRPMRDGVADPEGLSLNDLRILMALGGEGAAAGHDLAEIMGMQPMNVSRALATLSTLGLTEEVDDPANRRRRPHRLSKAGWQRHVAMGTEIAEVAGFIFGTLKASERAALDRILTKLNARIAEWQPAEHRRHVPRA